ncbi:prepilin peptidase [Candidatus Saccharibacteria bacterium]|nr:prepilin peptidase [Candidatus Saccharibacteria bacterium]
MIELVISVGLFVLGAALGSFAAATVWRLRARQLQADVAHGVKVSTQEASEVKKLTEKQRKISSDRSVCLHCGRQLSWQELIPVVSWLAVGGKCRTCKKPIGKMEILAEVVLGAAFVVSYLFWPYDVNTLGLVLLGLWFIVLVALAIHWMYDARWFLLLDKVTVVITVVAVLFMAFTFADQPGQLLVGSLTGIGLTILVLPGFYGALYLISRGAWIGLGDVKLLVPFALMLPSWEYGVLLIFLANLIGSLTLLPAMLSKKLTRSTRVPFGPFIIAAFIITFLFGRRILDLYFGAFLF